MSQYYVTPESEAQAQEAQAEYDPVKYAQFMDDVKRNQNLILAIIGGFAASIVAALLWALITYVTNFQIGFMAVGVGILVGLAVRYLGKGITTPFGVIGAAFALFGCVLGNLMTAVIAGSMQEGSSFGHVLSILLTSPGVVFEIYKEMFSPIDLLFYGIAIYEGFKLAFRQIGEDELAYMRKTPTTVPIQSNPQNNI